MAKLIKKIFAYLGLCLATLIILLVIFLYAIHFATPIIQKHHRPLETWVSHLMKQPVKIGGLHLRRAGFDPEIEFDHVVVLNKTNATVVTKVAKLQVSINLLDSLLHWRLEPELVALSGLNLTLYQDAAGKVAIAGISQTINFNSGQSGQDHFNSVLAWLLAQGEIYLHNVTIAWHDAAGREIIIPNLNLHLINNIFNHQLVGNGKILRATPSDFSFVINFSGDLLEYHKITADGYIKARNLSLRQLFPEKIANNFYIKHGTADTKLWFSWRNMHLQKIQSQFSLFNFVLRNNVTRKNIDIEHLDSNFLLKRVANSWNLLGHYKNIIFNIDDMFPRPLTIDDLQNDLFWRDDNNKWSLSDKNFSLKNSDLDFLGTIAMHGVGTRPKPTVNITGKFNLYNIASLANYYPERVMPKGLLVWLQQGIVSGKKLSGALLLRGPLDKFPFVDNSGKFLIKSNLDDFTLHYGANWPNLQHINGQMLFMDDSMRINANASMLHTPLKNVVAQIDNLDHASLHLQGDVFGNNQALLKFVQQSPLRKILGADLRGLNFTGPVAMHLRINLPIAKQHAAVRVHGVIAEDHGSLLLPDWKVQLKNLYGKIYFTKDSVDANNLSAELFHHPVNIKVRTIQAGAKHAITRVALRGAVEVNALDKKYNSALFNYLHGGFGYHLVLDLHHAGDSAANRLRLFSNLRGLSVRLPEPFAKLATQKSNLQINTTFSNHKALRTKISYGDKLQGLFLFKQYADKFKFYRGSLHLGTGAAHLLPGNGLAVTGYLPQFNWQTWRSRLVTKQGSSASLINKVDLNIGVVKAFSQVFNNTNLKVSQNRQDWLLDINNSKVAGKIAIPKYNSQQQIVANFSHLYFQPQKKQLAFVSPLSIPALHVKCNDLHFGNKKFDYFEVSTIKQQYGVLIDKLVADNSLYQLSASGRWQQQQHKQHSALYGKLLTNNIGYLLHKWKKTDNLIGGQGNIVFSLHWLGALDKPNIATLNGNLLLHFKQGRIIHLGKETEEKIGIGRVLNLFSLQSVSRNLTRNFKDLTQKGYNFSEAKGDFRLVNGDAYTNDANLEGTVAHIGIQGRVGLRDQDYDMMITLVPYVTSSLPLLVGLAGGPVAGVVTWVADELFRHTLQRATPYKYRVTGTWAHPHVVRAV